MNTKLDMAKVQDFALSLGQMITMQRPPHVRANPRQMMMTYAVSGEEDSFEDASRTLGMDMVVMAFKPGREGDGPKNVAVYEERDGNLIGWVRCSPWAYSKQGPCLLLVDDRDFGFGYDGTSLVMHWDVPTDHRGERTEVGRQLLRLMTQCVPPHQTILHRLDPPVRVKSPVRRRPTA